MYRVTTMGFETKGGSNMQTRGILSCDQCGNPEHVPIPPQARTPPR